MYTHAMNKQHRLVLLISIMASFVALLDGSVVNVALPAITRDLGGGLAVQQWVVDAYLITLGALMLVAGSFSDLFGRKRVLWWGLMGFGLASLLCAIAPNGIFLIVARALQGVAGALLVPSSLALIISAFSGRAEGKAIGTWTAWTGMAFVAGPLLGGILVDAASWRWIFAINIVPIAYTLWLMQKLELPEEVRENTKLDVVGALLGVVALGGPVYALIELPIQGHSNPGVYVPLVVGLLACAIFIWHERRTAHPMLPLSLFRVGNFFVGNIATIAIYGGLSIATFLLAVFVQQVGGYTALQAGLALMPVTVIMFICSSYFGALSGKYGPRFFMGAGPLVSAAGFLMMLRVDSAVSYLSLLPGILLFGFGLSITVAPLTTAILGSIDKKQAGIASAVNNAVARVAGLVGIAVIGLVVGTSLDIDNFRRGIILTAILLICGGVTSAIGIRNASVRN
jgi:EmrB/QacA subfamily drug resistance transporter